MPQYTKLMSEKYLAEATKREISESREKEQKSFLDSMFTATAALCVFAITFYACLNYPEWIEQIQKWF